MPNELDAFHFDESRENFESYASDNGFHYWSCKEFMELLGCDATGNVSSAKPVQRAITACNTLGIPIQENFEFSTSDVKITRFACYLIAMNADVKKPMVAKAQAYFAAIAARFSLYAQENEMIDRVLTREEITQQERSLSGVAKQSGVENYAYFQNAGYRGMYNMNTSQLRELKGAPDSRSPLDYMGATESAANTGKKFRQVGQQRGNGIKKGLTLNHVSP
jgi:DNA-damage-inducible protein D